MTSRGSRLRLGAALLSIAAGSAAAHDFWIEPSIWRPSIGDELGIDLRVGEFFDGEPVARRTSRIVAFVAVGPSAMVDIAGRDGDLPAGRVVVTAPGGLLIGYRSNRAFIELPADRFEAYLLEEGLEAVVEKRREAGDGAKPGREAYSRCAKALLSTPEGGRSVHDVALGFPLELMLQADPRTHAPGRPVAFRLFLDRRPVADALVVATPAADREICLRGRTDSRGLVSFTLEHDGPWLVRSVVMRPAPAALDADWESLWTSFTFAPGR